MSVTLTMAQIISIADFAGLTISDCPLDEDELEQEFTVSNNLKVDMEDGTYYEGMTVHISEYPEEGFMPLEEKQPIPSSSYKSKPNSEQTKQSNHDAMINNIIESTGGEI